VHPLERAIRSSDGILSTAELHRRGFDDDTIKLVVSYRKIVPIRRGWYASPDLPRDAFLAWRAGGRLTCLSAAAHLGLWPHASDVVHVRVAANASRVERSPFVVVHWSRGPTTGTRVVVSIDEMLATIGRCQPREIFHAVRRAANR